MDIHPALRYLKKVDSLAKQCGIWHLADTMLPIKNTAMTWPDYVFLPFAGWYLAACHFFNVSRLTTDEEIAQMQDFAIIGTWRMTQDIITFDPDVYATLVDTPLDADIPFSLLRQLPAWCVYIETPGLVLQDVYKFIYIDGFWAMIEYDVNHKTEELRLFFLTINSDIISFMIIIDENTTIEEAIHKIIKQDRNDGLLNEKTESLMIDYTHRAALDILQPAINLLLYVCTYGFSNEKKESSSCGKWANLKLDAPFRSFTAEKASFHNLCKDIGDAIRKEKKKQPEARESSEPCTKSGMSAKERKLPHAHIRRAHWHSFWTGKKNSGNGDTERKLVVKWIPPLPIAIKNSENPDSNE